MKLSLIIPTRRLIHHCLESIVKYTKDCEVVIIDGEKGFATKLNEGIQKAKGDYLVFLHDDCEVTEGWADELAEVGAFCLGENNDSFEIWGGFYRPKEGYCTDPKEHPDYAYFCCISKEAMNKIGLLDERYENPFYQDVDFGMQVRKSGYEYQCLPGKIIHHPGDGSGVPDERQKGYLHRKWHLDVN